MWKRILRRVVILLIIVFICGLLANTFLGSGKKSVGTSNIGNGYYSKETPLNPIPKFEESVTYVLNRKTKKFHRTNCGAVRTMDEENIVEFEGKREDAIALGYNPCLRCNP